MANDVAKEGDESSALRRVRVPGYMKNFRPMEETSISFQRNHISGDNASVDRLVNHLQLARAIKHGGALESLLPYSSRSKRKHEYISDGNGSPDSRLL